MELAMSDNELFQQRLCKTAGVAALLQLCTLGAFSIVMGIIGTKPDTAAEYFAIYEQNPVHALLRGDISVMILIGLYLAIIPALAAKLWKINPVWVGYAAMLSIIAAMGAIFSESSFSLLHLGARYVEAASEAARAEILAAGEAVIASDLWNSTAAYMGGIFLQGSGVVLSVVMLRSKDFSKVTAVSGLLGNAIDLVQHLVHPFAPSFAASFQAFMGVFYLVWYPMLARDFFLLAKKKVSI